MRRMWIDVETTGLSPFKNGVVQLAILVEDKKTKVVDKLELTMRPFEGWEYDPKALEINGRSKTEIMNYQAEQKAFTKILKFLSKQFGKDKTKFSFSGYNSPFDMKFIQALFRRNTDLRFDFYFNYYDVDTYALVKILNLEGIFDGKTCKKLGAICNTMGVEFKGKAHDAMVDIKATRKLHKKIVKKYLK